MPETIGLAATAPTAQFATITFPRREVGPKDVAVAVEYCGICHTDIHFKEGDGAWGKTSYPIIPGHEAVGHVTEVGPEAQGVKVGDLVGIGCIVDSCNKCAPCGKKEEQFCEEGMTWSYNSPDKKLTGHHGAVTKGGYSSLMVVEDRLILHLAKFFEGKNLPAAAPLLCAGITTYSPLRHAGVKPGDNVAVVGLGGLGHMGVKFAKAMGANVTVISTSASKEADAKALGADDFLVGKDHYHFADKVGGKFNVILDTVAQKHDMNHLLQLLATDGKLICVGNPPVPIAFDMKYFIMGRKTLMGSVIGGIGETQEMLDFCAEKGVLSDVEVVDPSYVDTAYERVHKSDVKYRFVLDITKLKQ